MKRFMNLLKVSIFCSSAFLYADETVESQDLSVDVPAISENADETEEKEISKGETVTEEHTAEEKEMLEVMKKIEPSFIPNNQAVFELFKLENKWKKNKTQIEKLLEEKGKGTGEFFQRYQEGLDNYLTSNSSLQEKYKTLVADVAKAYKNALKKGAHFNEEALYIFGVTSFENSEFQYYKDLSAYNKARESGITDVPFPMEDFSAARFAFENLIEQHPKFKYLDNVYYLYALALLYESAFDESIEAFNTLIKKYPKSRFAEEVIFRIAEYYYDIDEYSNALEYYKKILKHKKSPFYDKAVYKIAWTYFQKDQFDLSIKNFAFLLRLIYSKNYQGTLSGIKPEALKYFVKGFSEQQFFTEKTEKNSRSPEEEKEYQRTLGVTLSTKVYNYLKKSGRKPLFAVDAMIEAASQLLDQGKTEGCVKAFEYAIRLSPKNPDNPRIAAQIVDVLEAAGEKELARQKNLELIKKYGPKSRWVKSLSKNEDALRFAKDAVRDAILALAVSHHKAAKEELEKGLSKEAEKNFSEAAKLYLRYIKEYPEKEDIYKAIFYFAESVYELKRYKLALEAYQLLKNYPLPMPEPFRRDSVLNTVLTFKGALEEAAEEGEFKKIDFDNLTSKFAGKEWQEIPKIGQDYIDSINDFMAIVPNDEQVPVLLFHEASIYYVYGHLEEALVLFNKIIDTYPSSSAALVSAKLILDDAIAKEDWLKVSLLAKRFREENLGNQKDDFAKIEGNARFKIAKAVFDDANNLLKEGQVSLSKDKFKEAAQLFEVLLQEDPKNPFADVMLFNAAKAIVQSGSSAQALPYYVKLYTEHPTSEYAKVARFQEALLLEKMLKFAQAAKAYDGIIKQDPTSEAAGDAMLNKALLYEAAGDYKNAVESYLTFSKSYPNRPEASLVLLTSASIYKKLKMLDNEISILDQFVKRYQKDSNKIAEVIEAKVMIADTYMDLYKNSKNQKYEKLAFDNYKEAVKLYNPELSSPYAAFYAAKAHLFLEKPEQDAFKKMSINAHSGDGQAKQLTAMMKKLAELSAKNENIIKLYAQPIRNAESLYRIGELYNHLANALFKAPCPKDISTIDEFACDEYAILLEEKASVLEEKALDAYKQAYDIALNSFDTPEYLLDYILTALSKLRPGEYQKVGNVIEETHTYSLDFLGRMLSTGKMASTIHSPKEVDPDVPVEEEQNLKEETPEKKEKGDKDKESPHTEEVDDEIDESEEEENEDEYEDEDEEV